MRLASLIAEGGENTAQAVTPNLVAEQSECSEPISSRAEVVAESSADNNDVDYIREGVMNTKEGHRQKNTDNSAKREQRFGVEDGRTGGAEEVEVSLDKGVVMQTRR